MSGPGEAPGRADDEHLGWRISALLDGELGVTEEIVAREHLSECDDCQQEFAEVMAARSVVRDLGEVEPRDGYMERVQPEEPRRRLPVSLGLVGLLTVAAIWIVILLVGAGITLPDVEPPVEEFVERHELAAADPAGFSDRPGVEPLDARAAAGIDAPYVVPEELAGGFERVAAFDERDGVVQTLYAADETDLSLFEQEGTLDRGSLPVGGVETELGEHRAWVGSVDDGRDPPAEVVVVERGPIVYTVVARADRDVVTDVASELPEPQDYSLGERARQGLEELLRRFGLD